MTNRMDRPEPESLEGADRRDNLPPEAGSLEAGAKGSEMNVAHHPSKLEEQRPVSWVGWVIALVAGAAIWMVLFRLFGA